MNYKASYIIYNDLESPINDVLNNKISFSLNTMTTINHYSSVLNKDVSNIRLVSNLYKLYIYCFTLKKYNINSIKDLSTGTVIGILDSPDPFYIYCEKFMKDLGYNIGTDYKVLVFKSHQELFDGLLNGQCTMIIINDIFPSKSISNILDNSSGNFILLLPFDIYNEKIFLKKNTFVHVGNIDLNKLSNTYLPKTFGKYNYNTYKPNFKIAYIYKILISNSSTNEDYAYSFTKFLFENYKNLNKTFVDYGYYLDVFPTRNRLEYHAGTLKYMKEYGYISNINDQDCALLIGVMACNEENLKNNNLYVN